MKVKSLTLRSFRGIDNLTLDFDPKVTVLIGNNGVGKSSILDGLSNMFSPFLLFLRKGYTEQDIDWTKTLFLSKRNKEPIMRSFCDQDIANRDKELSTKIVLALREKEISWSITKARGNSTQDDSINELGKNINSTLREWVNNPELNLPLITYYPITRAVLSVSLEIANSQFRQIDAYDRFLEESGSGFEQFFIWFRTLEDLENEERRDTLEYRDRQLEAVRKAIPEFLPGFSNLRVRRSPLRMTVQKQGQELIINQLSDGEKCLLAMVGDLARRLAIANPGLLDPLQGEGVVLIDEIELHLHPKWQREIIPALTRTFPNCQFIVTTHSPQVLGEVKGKVYQLKSTSEGIIAESLQTYGRDSNQILEDVMDVPERSREFQDKIRHLFRLIEDGKLDEAKSLQQELEDSITYEEPEFVKSEILIRRKEVLGR
ncbi:AAA family ATPase [Phormidesmis sp. 146-12]